MIVVLDTNTIISALLSQKGAPHKVVEEWEAEKFDVAISAPLLDELAHVLNYEKIKKRLQQSQEQIDVFIKSFKKVAIFVEPKEEIKFIVDDPDDDRVLECAIEAGATYIISGDKHLLNLEEYRGIIILSSAGFLTILAMGK